MSRRIGEHIRSNVVGYIAVFIALSGTAYAVDGPLPGQNQVGSADIINGDVITDDISDTNGVRSADVRDDTLNNGGLQAIDLRADSVGGSEVSDESLGSAELAPDSVGASEVATGAIGSDELATDAVGTDEIIDGSVGNPDLGVNSVTGTKVFQSSLTGADIFPNSLSSSDIGADAVGDDEISPGAVGASEVANGSLGTAEFASSIPSARVTRSFNQGIPNDDEVVLNFNSERYDTAGMHSNSANLSRLTAPVDGIYLVTAQVQWDVNGFGQRTLGLERNGVVALARDRRVPGTDPVDAPAVTLTTVASLEAGDFVEAEVFQNSGGNLSVLRIGEESPEFTMTWLAPGP